MRAATQTTAVENDARKGRGAFFTPSTIAEFLASWGVHGDQTARVLDPTCGEAVFLMAAGRALRDLGCDTARLDEHLFGVDLHRPSLDAAMALLESEGLDAHLVAGNFFDYDGPEDAGIPPVDAIIGNPPFVRYQQHRDSARGAELSLRRGVRLSGLASSWAPLLVHASSFLKPSGRLAMVLPSELLTVQYAEPVRRWLRERFAAVTLVMFEKLQFEDATERVVLVLAHGTGGCESFNVVYVNDAEDLESVHFGDGVSVTPTADGKWTDLLLPLNHRQLFRRVCSDRFEPLEQYGSPELGTVTGGNNFFTLSEPTRRKFGLTEAQLERICPPGSRHLKGFRFTTTGWNALRDAGERVWLFRPEPCDDSPAVKRYISVGLAQGVDEAYKCQIRTPWWRSPMVDPPDLFFTYMSHRYPRLVRNSARVSFLNSMHGIRLKSEAPRTAGSALPLLALNSVTMLGAEIHGRSYGGGVLKMEPREARRLPVPSFQALDAAWGYLRGERDHLERQVAAGLWTNVVKRIDEVLLQKVVGLSEEEALQLRDAARNLRERRLAR